MMIRKMLFVLGLLALTVIAGCTFNVRPGGDGTFVIEVGIPESVMQTVIEVVLRQDIPVKSMDVKMRDGYLEVSGSRDREGGGTDSLSFNLSLRASAGRPVATISNAVLNGVAVDQSMVNEWNNRIAKGIGDFADQTPNANIDAIELAEGSVTLKLRVGR